MKTIQLTKGYVALVDDADYERVSQFKWHANIVLNKDGSIQTVYARRAKSQTHSSQYLNCFLLGITDKRVQIDHRDRNTLNYQRHNLRVSTPQQNCMNKGRRSDNKSGFKGVYWAARNWRAAIGGNSGNMKSRKNLGRFTSKIAAAQAYDAAAIEMFGEFAVTNRSLGLLPRMP